MQKYIKHFINSDKDMRAKHDLLGLGYVIHVQADMAGWHHFAIMATAYVYPN